MKNTLALVGTAALLLAACGDDDDEAPTAAKPAAPAKVDAALIVPINQRAALSAKAPKPADGKIKPSGAYVGKWGIQVTADQLAEGAADPRLAGRMGLELRADGTYTTSSSLDGKINGRYAAAPGRTLVFKQDSGCDYNDGFKGSRSVYRWSVEGDELVLTLVRRETKGCTGRSDFLTTPRWQRQ